VVQRALTREAKQRRRGAEKAVHAREQLRQLAQCVLEEHQRGARALAGNNVDNLRKGIRKVAYKELPGQLAPVAAVEEAKGVVEATRHGGALGGLKGGNVV
jgi:hypothetical protein